jgi:hypothetical protein
MWPAKEFKLANFWDANKTKELHQFQTSQLTILAQVWRECKQWHL